MVVPFSLRVYLVSAFIGYTLVLYQYPSDLHGNVENSQPGTFWGFFSMYIRVDDQNNVAKKICSANFC